MSFIPSIKSDGLYIVRNQRDQRLGVAAANGGVFSRHAAGKRQTSPHSEIYGGSKVRRRSWEEEDREESLLTCPRRKASHINYQQRCKAPDHNNLLHGSYLVSERPELHHRFAVPSGSYGAVGDHIGNCLLPRAETDL